MTAKTLMLLLMVCVMLLCAWAQERIGRIL